MKGASLVNVDGAGKNVSISGGLVDCTDDGPCGGIDDLDVAAGAAQVREVGGSLWARRIPEVSGGPALDVSIGGKTFNNSLEFRSKVADVGRCDRYFGGGSGNVRR